MKIVIEVKDLLELAEMRMGINRAIREISTELQHTVGQDTYTKHWEEIKEALEKMRSQME